MAIDAADVVLVNSHLSDVPAAIRLSRATLRNIHENLFWAFFYNTIGIPIAAGVFVPLGLTLNPMIGAAAMSLSSFCVVTNALRLNLFKLRDTRHDHKRANHLKEVPEIKEETAMKKTIQIEGMMCAHCEATVKKALEALPEVTEAEVSHTAGTAVVTLSAPVDDAVLKSTVEAKDYTVTASREHTKQQPGHPRRDAPAVFCSLFVRVDRLREQPVLRAVPQQCAVREVRQARLRAPVRV